MVKKKIKEISTVPVETTAETVAENAEITETPAEKQGILAYLKDKSASKRIWEIDFLRGFCVLLMILDHTCLMLSLYFGPAWYGGFEGMRTSPEFGAKLCALCEVYWNSQLRAIGHPIVLFIFFSISGISCAFSRSNMKRGILLAIVSGIYTLVTYLIDKYFMLGCFTAFGVLHFYAFCILLWAIICKICKDNKIAKMMYSGFMVILVAVLYYCYKAPATTPEWLFWAWPHNNADGTPATFYAQWAVSPGDLFTIIPWASFFFAGTFLQPILYSKRRSLLTKLDRGWHRPISFLGRHALWVYILHVVLVAVVLCIVSQIFFGVWGLF